MKLNIKSWDECPIATYREITKIAEDAALSETEKEFAALAILCDVSEDEVWKLTVSEAQALIGQLKWIGKFDFNKNPSSIKNVIINGIKCKVDYDLIHFSVAQYIDFQDAYKNGITPDNLPILLACLLIPEGKEYNEGYDLQKWISDIDNYLPITLANSIGFFCCNTWKSKGELPKPICYGCRRGW